VLFLIAGGVSGYYFRKDIPIIKNLIKNSNVIVDEINKEKNTQLQNEINKENAITVNLKTSLAQRTEEMANRIKPQDYTNFIAGSFENNLISLAFNNSIKENESLENFKKYIQIENTKVYTIFPFERVGKNDLTPEATVTVYPSNDGSDNYPDIYFESYSDGWLKGTLKLKIKEGEYWIKDNHNDNCVLDDILGRCVRKISPGFDLIVNFEVQVEEIAPVIPSEVSASAKKTTTSGIIDCGITSITVPFNLNDNDIKQDSVLHCLGDAILNDCKNAKGQFKDGGIGPNPDILEVSKDKGICYFKLIMSKDMISAYSLQNTTMNQYISCPISIAREISEVTTSTLPLDKSKPSEYAAGVYLYGSIGVFMENDFDQNKIKELGCSGEWIKSLIDSLYNARDKGIIAEVKSSISTARAFAELYFDQNQGSYKDVCKLGFNEVIDKLKNISGEKYFCYDSKESYAIAASLSTEGFYCAESSGFAGEIKNQITTTKCQ
jgi:hypothetical protein